MTMRVFEMNRILNLGMPRSLFHLSFWIWKMHLGIFIIKSQPRGRVPALTFAATGSTLPPTGPSRLIHLSKKSLKRKSVFKHWYDSAIKPRICKVLEKNFWGGSIIKWVILYPKHRTSGCHVIGSRDNHVSKFEVPKNVGSFFWYLHWIFPDFLSIDDFSIV